MARKHYTRGESLISTTAPHEQTRLRSRGYTEHADLQDALAAFELAKETARLERVAARDAALGRLAPAVDDDEPADDRPARSASKVEWRDYATGHGIDVAAAESATRDQLAAFYHDGTPLAAD
ncbi:hypothetical protein [Serinicoccus sediminis]|uniref:hypothetical protein n=1 Tax=Serinicoccus sediminis TaxID=2306021 RepID=UPI001020F7DE|nr:hypothetical protein [Serinicoccus sediminis]